MFLMGSLLVPSRFVNSPRVTREPGTAAPSWPLAGFGAGGGLAFCQAP